MAATFDLTTIQPEELTFPDKWYDGDGKVYRVKTTDLLGAADYARYRWCYEEMRKAIAIVERVGVARAARAQAGRVIEQVTDEMLAIIAPDVPVERIAAMPFAYKSSILDWWKEQQPKVQPGEATAGEQVIRGKRSPASSSKATIPSTS